MKRLLLLAALALPVLGTGAAQAAPPPRPFLDCPKNAAYHDVVFKVYGTDPIQQTWRYYVEATWCTRWVVPPSTKPRIVRFVAQAWGECAACATWDFKGNMNGPIVSSGLPTDSMTVYARGKFAYQFPPWKGVTVGYSEPWIQPTITATGYTCASGRDGRPLGAVFHPCVKASGA